MAVGCEVSSQLLIKAHSQIRRFSKAKLKGVYSESKNRTSLDGSSLRTVVYSPSLAYPLGANSPWTMRKVQSGGIESRNHLEGRLVRQVQ